MTEATYLAVEVDAGHSPFYWEIYSQSDMAYIATVEAEDFGDYLATTRAVPSDDGDPHRT